MLKYLVLLSLAAYLAQAEMMRFKISAKNLPKSDLLRTIDPYVRVYYKTANGTMEVPLGRTLPKFNNMNPTWGRIFAFDYKAGTEQKLHLKVFDTDLGLDDFVGEGYLDLDEHMRNGENTVVPLRQGTLTVTKV